MCTHGTNEKDLSAAADHQSENLGLKTAVVTDSDAKDNFHDTSDLPLDDLGGREIPPSTGIIDAPPDATSQSQSNLATENRSRS